MAAPVQSHARIRLNFVNLPIESTWMLIDYKRLPLISDIVYEINSRHFGGSCDIILSLQGSCLPLQEKSLLLRDEDVITVRAEDQDNDSSTSNRSTTKITSTSGGEVKKTRKRKHDETEETVEEQSSKEEDRKSKKKHKKEKKKREKERLKEIVDIVSTFTDFRADTSKGSSKNDSSKDLTERASKRMKVSGSESQEKSTRNSSTVFQDTPASNNEPMKSGKSGNEDHENIENNAEGKKSKRKRTRKHRKRKNKSPSLDNLDTVATAGTINTSSAFQNEENETVICRQTKWDKQVTTYQGKPVDETATLYGSLPDKLLQPKYYRHQYRNLRQYKVEPNKHTKFGSDSENEGKEELRHNEQYNFLCSTRYSEFQESNSQESVMNASPEIVGEKLNDSNIICQSSSTPNTSSNAREKTGNSSIRSETEVSKTNGDLSHEFGSTTNRKNSSYKLDNKNMSNNDTSYNGYNGYVEEANEATADAAVPTTLVRSRLPNGVTVYSRQRRSFPKSEMFSKEEQLNTVATNRSFIYQNPVEPENVQDNEFVVDPGETLEAEKIKKNYASFPALAGPPRIGDKIAYKILEMSSEYTPEVSDYKEAEVMSFDHQTQNVQLRSLFKSDSSRNKSDNKFHVSVEDEDVLLTNIQPDSDEAVLHWSSLLEPRLVS